MFVSSDHLYDSISFPVICYNLNMNRKRMIIYISAAATLLALIITAIILIVAGIRKSNKQKEPRIITLTIDAPDDLPLEEKERIVFESLRSAGYSTAGVCGMMGNILVESSDYDPLAHNESSDAFGIFQWTNVGDRQQKLKDFCKEHALNWGSLDGQITFAVYELSGGDPIACRLDDFLKETDNAYAAAAEFTAGFERCIADSGKAADKYTGSLYPEFYGEYYQNLSKRINKAMNYYERFKDYDREINIEIE